MPTTNQYFGQPQLAKQGLPRASLTIDAFSDYLQTHISRDIALGAAMLAVIKSRKFPDTQSKLLSISIKVVFIKIKLYDRSGSRKMKPSPEFPCKLIYV